MIETRSAVVDASVAVKWALLEEGREGALALLGSYVAGDVQLIAPRLLLEEAASAIAKRHLRKQLTTTQAHRAFEILRQRAPMLIDNGTLLNEAFQLSIRHQLSLWDCLYLALAIQRRCDLVTADKRFHGVASPHYPFVRLTPSYGSGKASGR